MSYLILVRHSLVEAGDQAASNDWALSAEGRDLCLPLAEAIRPYPLDVVVSSKLQRASQTAELLAEHLGIDWRTDEGLQEHRRPFVPAERRAGEDFRSLMRRLFASPSERIFGEESADEGRQRFAAAVDRVLDAEPGRSVGIVSHGTVLALYAAPLFGLQPIELWGRMGWPSFLVVEPDGRTGLQIVVRVGGESQVVE